MSSARFSLWPVYSDKECKVVSDVLSSGKVNYWTGQIGRLFEKEFASWLGVDYAIAISNGTAALEVALHALNIQQGDEVLVTPRSFIASVSCIVNLGAIPVFIDVERDSGNIDASLLVDKITNKTKAILCVHLAGWPCEMDAIMRIANDHDLYVVEDCAQAHGARYKGRSVGTIGHIGCWSFCQDKIMTTGGEGGMVTTNNYDLWSKMWSYKDHGKSWEAVYKGEHSSGFQWVHESFGTNMRLTEMQAAIGRIQIKKMEGWSKARDENAEAILDVCRKFSDVLRVPIIPGHIKHAWYKCYVYLKLENIEKKWTRDKVLEEINSQGVPCYAGSCSEIYMEKAFDSTSFRPINSLSVANELGASSLMFLVHPTLTKQEINKTCNVIKNVMRIIEK